MSLVPIESPWARSGAEVCRVLAVEPAQGLDRAEVERRRGVYGANQFAEFRARSSLSILVEQFRSLLVALLAVAAVVSFVFAQWSEGAAVVVVLVINGIIGFLTELRAVRSMEALRELGTARVTVRRDGRLIRIDAAELVPGDIVIIEGGDVVTADLRLIEASRLQANESALTGESVPVAKSCKEVGPDVILAERTCMLFKGTAVTRGAGEGVVVATGLATELGSISKMVAEAETETTPLEKKLNRLGQALVWITLLLAALIGMVSAIAGTSVLMAVQTAIALAVASVPEGLPIIATLALARGMHRMAARNALVNRLSAVETLGATSIICTDKTGTLTENRMTVARFELSSGTVSVTGEGLEVDGHFLRAGTEFDPADDSVLATALRIGVLCNDAEVDDDGGVGDPLEVALLVAGRKAGLSRSDEIACRPEVREVAFDSDVKMMATVHEDGETYLFAVKGAPEALLARCTKVLRTTGVDELSEDERSSWLARSGALASEGLRLLGLAYKDADSTASAPYEDLVWVGLACMLDPPRADVVAAIRDCRSAGVRVVMVTGDHAVTARTIAEAVGIDASGEPLPGTRLMNWEQQSADAREELVAATVFARVSPKEKLELVRLHQKHGAVVAMTGDGVNDAPALKKADIGVAMGMRGTDVAREAADMVLRDDAFGSIAAAIREGRVIFDNIRSFVVYLLSCNLSEILVVGIAMLAAGVVSLLPLQILFLNLVTDVFPALALGASKGSPNLMTRPPRDVLESIIERRQWYAIVTHGLIMAVSVLSAFFLAREVLGAGRIETLTISFATLALAQLWHVFNMRSPLSGIFVNEITTNRWVWGALALCVGLLAFALYVPPLARVLSVQPPSLAGWLVIGACSSATMVLGQSFTFARGILFPPQKI